MERKCSLAGIGNFACGESRGKNQLINVIECNEDIQNHLRSCHLARLNISERELILARAGHFNPTEQQMANMHVCSKHRDQLGRFFRPLRSCQYPLHNGPTRKCHGRDVISLKLSQECLTLYGSLVQLGSCKYVHVILGTPITKK